MHKRRTKKENATKCRKKVESSETTSKYLSLWLLLPILFFCRWGIKINQNTLIEVGWWWYILCAIIGLAIGIIRLIRDKEISWNWEEYLGAIFYSFIHSAMGLIIGVLLIFGVEIANYYIPSEYKYYNESATIINKDFSSLYRAGFHFDIEFHFVNKEFGVRTFDFGNDFYKQAEIGDRYTFTFQNGFFNIPIIKGKAKLE